MSIVVLGVNHRDAPLSVLERVAIGSDALVKAIDSVTARASVSEAVVVSTCNRTEIYAVAERFHDAFDDLCQFFCDLSGLELSSLEPYFYAEFDTAAVTHLFEVASGLASDVLGEHEILGQVRDAWLTAQQQGATRSTLNSLFRHAVETGKRARTETAIGRSTASVSQAAVEMALDVLGSLADRRVLVVGAGAMGEGMAVALHAHGVAEIAVTNRTAQRAEPLARRVGGRVVPWTDLRVALAESHVVLTSTGAPAPLIGVDLVEAAMSVRAEEPLLIVDVAVPRDVAGGVGAVNGVTLLDLDDLRAWAQRGADARAEEVAKVADIVSDEVERFELDAQARQAAPLIAQLREHFDATRRQELARAKRRLASLDSAQLAAVEALTASLIAKLLHQPITALRSDAGTPRGDRNAAVVRDLFGLD